MDRRRDCWAPRRVSIRRSLFRIGALQWKVLASVLQVAIDDRWAVPVNEIGDADERLTVVG